MPKTRRAQPLGGKQTASRSGTRTKKDAKSLAQEEEKENLGRQTTESRQHHRSGVLGATTTLGISKAVGKRQPSRVKQKKLPLQDITSQFLPAPEPANRGASSEGGAHTLPIQEPSNPMTFPTTFGYPNLLTSPLPPSSPPADLLLSTVKLFHFEPKLLDGIDDDLDGQPDNPFMPDNEYNAENDRQTSTSSDPFGFSALERKLKEERHYVTNAFNTRDDVDDYLYEDLLEIPVADTSSPRPVRRIQHSLIRLEGEHLSKDEEIVGALDSLVNPHFTTPPTPHKDKHVQRRLSREGQDIFSPCSSSLESSPSPTKASSNKRRASILYGPDPLEEFNKTIDESDGAPVTTDTPPSKRQCQVAQKQDDEHHSPIARNLRPRRPTAAVKAKTVPKLPKDVSKARSNKKPKPNSSKTIPDNLNDEKWKREREERIKYFDSLTEYSVEKENVFII